MENSIQNSVLKTVKYLHKSGVVTEVTLKEIESLCIPEIKPFTSRAIIRLRHNLKLSQTAFARVLNTSKSTVQKWETGAKHPSGLALKLLSLAASSTRIPNQHPGQTHLNH